MIEMRGGKDLKYSSELPAWSKYAHAALFAFLGLVCLAFLGAGLYMLTVEDNWTVSLVFFLCFVLFIWVIWFGSRFLKLQYTFLVQTELREDGYYTLVINRKTGEKEENLISFSQMSEVLIGRLTRYVSVAGQHHRGYYANGARIIMVWRDEQGRTQYAMFSENRQDYLDQWIHRFYEQQIPVYTTEENLNRVQHTHLPEAYEQIPKDAHSGKPFFRTDFRTNDTAADWQSEGMRKQEAVEQARNDAKFFRPVFLATIVCNFLVACLWMPHWPVEDGVFSDNAPTFLIVLPNIFLIVCSQSYWRKRTKWYRPLLDTLILLAVQTCGMAASLLYRDTSATHFEALAVDAVATGIFLCIVFFVIRIATRKRKVPQAK
ncbi:hypothetical protein ACAF76_002385 [Brevibacillus sp. TJ4]|uniref:hypothetical protein n=1 Tax=Brevibacillus sp. TJ4 TaxID=3234853 RepID=UPI0037D18ACC